MRYLLLALIICSVLACEEIPPVITPSVPSTDCQVLEESLVAGQQRRVIIEEFTGVRCVFCPGGSEAIEALLDQHGDRLTAISYHAGFYSVPYEESLYDFRTEDAERLLELIGRPLGFPTAAVDRKLFEGEDDIQLGRADWASTIEQQLSEPLELRIALISEYQPENNRQLNLEVGLFPDAAFDAADDLRLSVLLVENGIVDYQQTQGGTVSDYEHKHVFREFISPYAGGLIASELSKGEPFCQSFEYQVPDEWNADKMSVIALVHRGGISLEVLQTVETKLK